MTPIRIHRVFAGDYWTDGGAMLGVLPWALWSRKIEVDERRRKKLNLNSLLILAGERVILVDTGLGNRLSDKQKDIYQPSGFMLPASLAELGIRDIDVTDVVLTHLHFDHAGGVVTGFGDADRLTFPRARHWIQASEWNMAKDPDELNRASYNFDRQLALLEARGRYELIQGDAEIAPGVKLHLAGGHTVGSQIVEIEAEDGFYIYAADIIPTMFHTALAITSAYDVCRRETTAAKEYIYTRLRERQGRLLLNHDPQHWELPVTQLPLPRAR
ncbi:MAG: MBL fold metallo-hydrolase [Candidatus Cloacimonadota bacterium]|nr:MBL fold metallo-hydrolase [Candidatus Cloacimonadota bacterium]